MSKNSNLQNQQQSGIRIVERYIKSIKFDSVKNTEKCPPLENAQLQFGVPLEVFWVQHSNTQYEVGLRLKAEATHQNMHVFSLELSYGAICILSDMPEGEEKNNAINVICPTIIFPFARIVFAEITRDAGFQPVLLDNIDFASIYANSKANEKVAVN